MLNIKRNNNPFVVQGIPRLFLLLIFLLLTITANSLYNPTTTVYASENPAVTENLEDQRPEQKAHITSNKYGGEAESSKDNSAFFNDIPGTGAFLGTILHSLSLISTDSEIRFKSLINHIPEVFPDLRKVFLTL